MSATTRAERGAPQDPMQLTQATVNAVDAIGEHTAKEFEASADELERQAHDTATYLRKLATGMRRFSQEAAQQVSDFCLKNQEVLSTIKGLEQKIKGQQAIDPPDDDKPTPSTIAGAELLRTLHETKEGPAEQ